MPRSFPLRHLPFVLSLAYGSHAAVAQQAQPAQPADTPALSAVTVRAATAQGFVPNTVEAGSFRGSDIMDVPSTVNVVTREVLELQGAAGLYDALRNTAGVTRQQNGGETWDQLVIRGIGVENRTNYRLNGSVPVLNFSQIPMENKERVEVLKGASALYYGFTSPAGIVNLVTKRASAQPVTSLGLVVDQYGKALASVDVGRRLGDEQQYGLRVNAAGGALGSYLDGVGNGGRSFASAAFDWRVTNRLSLKADLDYDHRKTTEQVGVALRTAVNGAITLPNPVDAKKLVGPNWSSFDADTRNAQLRADYTLSDNWALTVEAGQSHVERGRQLAIFSFANDAGVASGAGSIRGNIQNLEAQTDLLRAELFGSFATFGIQHGLTLGATRTRFSQSPIYQQNYTIASQNLYNPLPITTVTFGAVPTTATTAALDTQDTGLYALDQLQLSSQWQLMLGLRHSRYQSDQGSAHYDASKTTPMAALVYKLSPAVSLYTSYANGLEQGDTAPTGTANVGERMAPGVSKQKELGMRWRTAGGTLLSSALFHISRPGYYTNSSNVYTADGRQNYTGVELSTQGQLTSQLSWQTSAQWLDAEFRNINASYNGKSPENTAKQTGSVFLSYALASVPGLSVNGGAYYTGRRPVNDLNQAWLGGVTLYSLGARYATRLAGYQTSWQLNVDNVAGKEYWAAGGTRLAAGAPRTAKLAFKLDL
ncbi:iron complex outermembrane receptor protein [Rhodoferax ferrireducens]|uniref:Iron complex outermembrane receptor protein n=1 Tax=Rhodoferax ferrireducens TaxID=192843 RepID=A0ABU2C338_9BURK|nr:TonB-dependent siderophore receptor [Rhodoferax ferrireducens]MDR7375734.1 iron complex outermembrane receptor protein [Rhodoferax ferrireducens]